MLTATYALLTLSFEQKKERNFLARFRHYLPVHASKPQAIDPASLVAQLDELTRFAEARHQHKVEDCLMPAVRAASSEAGPLLADLETLNRVGNHMLGAVRRRLRRAFDQGRAHIKMLCFTLERYCQNLLERLEKEERELLPLAQRVISSDKWFTIGAMFLSHDAAHDDLRRHAKPIYPGKLGKP